MDLNGMKDKAQQVKAPPIGGADREHGTQSLDDLVARLHAADDRVRGGMRKAFPLYAIATACWLFVFVIMAWFPPKSRPASEVLFWGFLFGLYLLLTTGVRWRLRRLAEIDYTSPTRQFLAAAERRFGFMRPKDYLVSGVGCLLLGIVAGLYVINLMVHRYFGPEHRTLITVLYGVSYVGLCAMGFILTYRNWKRDSRALWLELRQMLAEFDGETASTPPAAGS